MIFIKEYGYHWTSYFNDIVTNMGFYSKLNKT